MVLPSAETSFYSIRRSCLLHREHIPHRLTLQTHEEPGLLSAADSILGRARDRVFSVCCRRPRGTVHNLFLSGTCISSKVEENQGGALRTNLLAIMAVDGLSGTPS